jgi:hypothetical protein
LSNNSKEKESLMGKPEENYVWAFDVSGVIYNVCADTEAEAYEKVACTGQRVSGSVKLTAVTERKLLIPPTGVSEMQERMVGAIESMCDSMKEGMDAEKPNKDVNPPDFDNVDVSG